MMPPIPFLHLPWIELSGFDNTRADCAVRGGISRMGEKPAAVSLSLWNT